MGRESVTAAWSFDKLTCGRGWVGRARHAFALSFMILALVGGEPVQGSDFHQLIGWQNGRLPDLEQAFSDGGCSASSGQVGSKASFKSRRITAGLIGDAAGQNKLSRERKASFPFGLRLSVSLSDILAGILEGVENSGVPPGLNIVNGYHENSLVRIQPLFFIWKHHIDRGKYHIRSCSVANTLCLTPRVRIDFICEKFIRDFDICSRGVADVFQDDVRPHRYDIAFYNDLANVKPRHLDPRPVAGDKGLLRDDDLSNGGISLPSGFLGGHSCSGKAVLSSAQGLKQNDKRNGGDGGVNERCNVGPGGQPILPRPLYPAVGGVLAVLGGWWSCRCLIRDRAIGHAIGWIGGFAGTVVLLLGIANFFVQVLP